MPSTTLHGDLELLASPGNLHGAGLLKVAGGLDLTGAAGDTEVIKAETGSIRIQADAAGKDATVSSAGRTTVSSSGTNGVLVQATNGNVGLVSTDHDITLNASPSKSVIIEAGTTTVKGSLSVTDNLLELNGYHSGATANKDSGIMMTRHADDVMQSSAPFADYNFTHTTTVQSYSGLNIVLASGNAGVRKGQYIRFGTQWKQITNYVDASKTVTLTAAFNSLAVGSQLVISSAVYTTLSAAAVGAQTFITVTNPELLKVNRLLKVHVNGNPGTHVIRRIVSFAGSNVTLDGNLGNSYSAGDPVYIFADNAATFYYDEGDDEFRLGYTYEEGTSASIYPTRFADLHLNKITTEVPIIAANDHSAKQVVNVPQNAGLGAAVEITFIPNTRGVLILMVESQAANGAGGIFTLSKSQVTDAGAAVFALVNTQSSTPDVEQLFVSWPASTKPKLYHIVQRGGASATTVAYNVRYLAMDIV